VENELNSRLKAHLAGLAIVGLALVAAPNALADNPPTQVSPSPGETLTARSDQLSFQAQATANPTTLLFPTRMDFYVSRDSQTNLDDGVLSNPIDTFRAGAAGDPPLYTAGPGPDANWPYKPGTYYWQAVYHDCTQALDCFNQSSTRTLILDPLPPPDQASPANGATIRFAGRRTFSIRDVPSYSHDATRLNIEFSRSAERASDGTFAHPLLIARPASAGEGVYEHVFGRPFTNHPGTYYWIAERFDCAAEPDPDCYVTSDEVRSFTVAEVPPGTAPNTVLRRHPAHRTHKRRIRFTFRSNLSGASFQCFYTGGWTSCRSPQIFRHLKPGRYRFKVRAVLDGKKDPSPVSWLFRVVRRH
jgi:hypothetical protein